VNLFEVYCKKEKSGNFFFYTLKTAAEGAVVLLTAEVILTVPAVIQFLLIKFCYLKLKALSNEN
jgi:hypothetical protein